MPPYERRQIGQALVAISVIQCASGIGVFFANQVAGMVIAAAGVLTGWLFATLTVTVDEEAVSFHFGPGLIGRRIALADIRASRVVRLPWYSGVGIHFTMNGMLYNVAFGPVVQLELQNGRRVNIGSPEPDLLCAAIQERASHGPGAHSGTPAHGVPWPLASAGLVACVALVVACVVVLSGRQPIEVTLANGVFEVSGAGYSTTLATKDIVALSLRDSLPHVEHRTNGYAFGSRLRGAFTLDELGRAHVYIDREVPPFLVVQSSTTVVVVNEPSAEATRDLFERLRQALPPR